MATKLFGNNVEPACACCEQGRPAPDKVMVLCKRYGPVAPLYCCKHFAYDPLKRVPRRLPTLPQFSQEDFDL